MSSFAIVRKGAIWVTSGFGYVQKRINELPTAA
jgi:hypothetical protein